MRTVSVLEKLLGIEGARVVKVGFSEVDDGRALVVAVQLRAGAASRCPHCEKKCAGYDQRPGERRRWRHQDLAGWRCYVEAPARRVRCRTHGVVTEMVPWARPGARMTRAFDDTVAWLTAHSPMSAVQAYMRVSWRSVARIVERVVADQLGRKDRLDGLRRIGIDEIAYRKGHRYLVVVVDHDTGQLVWAGEGATKDTLARFFDELGDLRSRQLTHVSADGAEYIAAVLAERAPEAIWCMDPFHVLMWVTQAMDRCRMRVLSRIAGLSDIDRRSLRWALLKNPEDLTGPQRRVRRTVVNDTNSVLARAYQLKEELRHLLAGRCKNSWKALQRWLGRAENSGIPEIGTAARSIRAREIQIYNAIECKMSNARVEATNTHLRALTKRAYGFHTPDALVAMANLTRGGACPALAQQL